MIWQMINLGKPRHLLHPSKSSISLKRGDRAHSEVLVNVSEQLQENSVIGMCRGQGMAEGPVAVATIWARGFFWNIPAALPAEFT